MQLCRCFNHLRQASRRVEHEFIGQNNRKRLVAYDVARAPDRMPEPQRRLLPREAHGSGFRLIARQDLHLHLLATRGKRGVEFEHPVEMVLDHPLVAPGDEDEMFDAGFLGLVDHILDQRLVDDGQHFLGHRLGGWQDAGAETGDGEDGFADFYRDWNCVARRQGKHILIALVEWIRHSLSHLPRVQKANVKPKTPLLTYFCPWSLIPTFAKTACRDGMRMLDSDH